MSLKKIVEDLLHLKSRHVLSMRLREDSGLLAMVYAVMQVLWPSVEVVLAALPRGRTYLIGVDRKNLSRIHFALAVQGRQLHLGGPGPNDGEGVPGLGPASEADACRAALQKALKIAEDLVAIDRRTPLSLEAAENYIQSQGGEIEPTLKVLGLLGQRPIELELGTGKTVVGGIDDPPLSFPSSAQKQVSCNVVALREDGRYVICGDGSDWPFNSRRKIASADGQCIATVLGMATVFACRVRCTVREVLPTGGKESIVQVEAVRFEEALDVEVLREALKSAQVELELGAVESVT